MNVENVMNIVKKKNRMALWCNLAGRRLLTWLQSLQKYGVNILGTSLESIDAVEDRKVFEKLLSDLEIPQPKGKGVKTMAEALSATKELGYPVFLCAHPMLLAGAACRWFITMKNY